MIIRNWRDAIPYVGHESKIIWPIFTGSDREDAQPPESACLLGLSQLTRHVIQGRITSDYHDHENVEQVYYFVRGSGKMCIDDQEYPVTAGDAVHLPPKTKHQVINDGEDEIEYLNISAVVAS
jgi:mannose-6-phosphate isomerase-like protein (cupin superfamily)